MGHSIFFIFTLLEVKKKNGFSVPLGFEPPLKSAIFFFQIRILLETSTHQLSLPRRVALWTVRFCLTPKLGIAGTTGAILMCAFLVDIVVWYKAGSINFVDEPPPEQTDELSPIKSRSETSV